MTPSLPIRRLQVAAVRPLSPRMTRVTLGGADLSGFALAGPDQQVTVAGTVGVDFHLHAGVDEGPATRWARTARPGRTWPRPRNAST